MYTILEWEEADLLDAGIVYKPLPALPGEGGVYTSEKPLRPV